MRSVNIHEAKTHLSRLVDEASEGKEVIIAKSGKPLARLVAFGKKAEQRVLGPLVGQFSVPDDFDEPLPADIMDDFEGRRG